MGKTASSYFGKYKKSFCVRMDVPNMPLSRIERLQEIFSGLCKEVLGKRIEKTTLKTLRASTTCKFIVTFIDASYDPDFTSIIILNLAKASVAMSFFKNIPERQNDYKRKAKMCFCLYMDRNKVEMNKIKKEYAEIS